MLVYVTVSAGLAGLNNDVYEQLLVKYPNFPLLSKEGWR